MKTVKRILSAVLAALLAGLCLCACGGGGMKADEVRGILPALVEKSRLLNRIYFGEGFPVDPDRDIDPEMGAYFYADTEEIGLASIEQIKAATEEVFTPEYAALLYLSAFDGMTVGETVAPPRYIETEEGLMQAMQPSDFTLSAREYDYATLKVLKGEKDRVTVSVETSVGESRETVRLTLVRTGTPGAYVYRLDSPTY